MAAFGLEEVALYAKCPERARRYRLNHLEGINPLEVRYAENLRKMVIRYYTEKLDDNPVTEAQLRRSWSTLWDDVPDDPMRTRVFDKTHSSDMLGFLSDTERLCIRGAEAIHKLFNRGFNRDVYPVIVDEPFSLDLGNARINGTFHMVCEDRNHRFWIVDWSKQTYKYQFQYDLRHAIMLTAFQQMTGKIASGVIVDYLGTLGDIMQTSTRTPEALQSQMEDVQQVVRSMLAEICYKSISEQCNSCPYKATCRGISVVKKKRPRGRPGKRADQS